MSARLARGAFASVRASARGRANIALPRRNMSAQSHGTQPKKSDLPWVVGAGLLFGPLFLYLVSPSARKNTHAHAVHNDHHDHPGLKNGKEEKESKGPEIMKDDEGTPADVTASIALSEQSDVPKDSQSPDAGASTKTAAEEAPVGEGSGENKEDSAKADAAEDKTEQPKAEESSNKAPAKTPAEQSEPREAAREGKAPSQEKSVQA